MAGGIRFHPMFEPRRQHNLTTVSRARMFGRAGLRTCRNRS